MNQDIPLLDALEKAKNHRNSEIVRTMEEKRQKAAAAKAAPQGKSKKSKN